MSCRRRHRFAGLLVLASLWAPLAVSPWGCQPQPIDERTPKPAAVTPQEQAEAVVDRPRAPGEDDGLEVARWSIANNEVLIRRSLARYAKRDVRIGVDAATLEHHGFRAVIMDEADLTKFLIDVGGTTKALTVWFGQVPSWRELARTLLESPRVAMIDGKAERLPGGWLRLMTRAWTVPLEEGGYLDVQVAAQLVSDSNDISGLLNRDSLRGRVWETASIHAELPRNAALILISAPPESPDLEEDPEGPPSRPENAGSGPAAELPPTLGEFLLTDFEARPSRRMVLVLKAKLPDILFVEPVPTAGARPAPMEPVLPAPSEDPPADAP